MRTARRSLQALMDVFPDQLHGSFLDLGSSDGVLAVRAAQQLGESCYCTLDLRACRAAGTNQGVSVYHSDKPPPGSFGTILMDSHEFEPAFARELSHQTAVVLSQEGVLLTVPPEQDSIQRWGDHLAQAYGDVAVISDGGGPPVLAARRPRKVIPPLEDSSWIGTVSGERYRFHTGPGVFSPRGLDLGTLTMLEAVLEAVPRQSHRSVLDLGCGVGSVAIPIASLMDCQVVATDVNARALRLTELNAVENGVAERVQVLASDGFSDLLDRQFDLIVTHPPYHADYAVAKEFIEGAFRHIRLGGALWLVVKQPNWYSNKLRSVFGGCRMLELNGYWVLTSERKASNPKKEPTLPTTRKHQKRLQQSDARNKRSRRGVK